MALEKVTLYRAADGSLHDSAALANAHNAAEALLPALRKIAESVPVDEDVGAPALVGVDEIAGFLLKQSVELRVLLNEHVRMRAPRTKKTDEAKAKKSDLRLSPCDRSEG